MNKVIEFIKEAWAELKLVSWLSVPHMIASTWMVIILSAIVAAYVFGVDQILKQVMKVIL